MANPSIRNPAVPADAASDPSLAVISTAPSGVVDESPLGVVKVDLDRSILYANRAALRIFGVTDYAGLRLDQFFPDADSRDILIQQIEERRAGRITNYQVVAHRLSDGHPVPLEITGVPLTDVAGTIIGAIGVFRSLENQALATRIHNLNREIDNGNQLLTALGEALQPVFAFDRMSVARYSADQRHVNGFFVYGQQGNRVNQTRWWPLTEAQRAWFNATGTRVVPELQDLLDDDVWRAFRDEPAVKEIVRAGIRSLMRKDVRRGGVLLGSITLMSKTPNGFTEEQRAAFDELPIDATVLQAMQSGERQQMAQRLHVVRVLNRCSTVDAACRALAEELVRMFAWSHVSIFLVDKPARCVRMIAQSWNTAERIRLPDEYQQPVDVGLLGRTVATRKLQNVGKVKDDPDYIAGVQSTEVNSELCVPISREDGAVRWIINVEDSREHAFAIDECAALEDLAGEVSGVMHRISQVYFLTQCFERASDPILVTDANLKINKANVAAADLLGFASARDVVGNLVDYFSEAEAGRLTSGDGGSLGEFTMKRLGEGGKDRSAASSTVPVFLSRKDFREGFGGSIFVAQDTRHIRRAVELELLERAAYEVAAETSAPLAMAINELERLARSDPTLADRLSQVLRRLGRVRHGYIKLAMFNPEARPAAPELSRLSLGDELAAFVESLTDNERTLVRLNGDPEAPSFIRGNHFQIHFVLESLLSALMRAAPESEPVVASVTSERDTVALSLLGFAAEAPSEDARPGQAAGDGIDLAIATPLVRQFVEAHRGTLARTPAGDGRVRYVLRFPAAPEPSR